MSNEHSETDLVATQEVGSPMALASVLNHFDTGTPENVTEIDDEEEAATRGALPALEEEQEEEPKKKLEKEKPTDDDPYKDYTEAALVLEQFKQSGRLPDSVEIKQDMDWAALMDIITNDANDRYNTAVSSYVDDLGEAKKYIEHLMNGGSPQTVEQAISLDDLVKMETNTEENREALIKAMYQSKGLEGPGLESAIEGLKLKGKDQAEAEKAQEFFETRQKDMLSQETAQRKQADDYQRQQFEQERSDIQAIIQSGDLGLVKLESESQKKKFLEDMFTPTIKITYTNQQGKQVPTRITRYQQKLQEMETDTKKRLLMAHLLLDDFDMGAVKEKVKIEENSKLLDALNARTTRGRSSTQKREEESAVWSQPL